MLCINCKGKRVRLGLRQFCSECLSTILSLSLFIVILESLVVGDARGIDLHIKPTFLVPWEVSSPEKNHVKGEMR